ncbi:MAG TPA: hypothetical protein VFZ85_00515 [Jiangellaceae bacterium]
MLPRRFALIRHVDYTGVSGIGVVAYGVTFADGHVVLRWCSNHPATSMWNSMDDMLAVHGHGEATSVEWIDAPHGDLEGFPGPRGGRRGRRRANRTPALGPDRAEDEQPSSSPELPPRPVDRDTTSAMAPAGDDTGNDADAGHHPADGPVDGRADNSPVDTPGDSPVSGPVDSPVSGPVDSPAGGGADGPMEVSAGGAAAAAVGDPAYGSMSGPADGPVDGPVDASVHDQKGRDADGTEPFAAHAPQAARSPHEPPAPPAPTAPAGDSPSPRRERTFLRPVRSDAEPPAAPLLGSADSDKRNGHLYIDTAPLLLTFRESEDEPAQERSRPRRAGRHRRADPDAAG